MAGNGDVNQAPLLQELRIDQFDTHGATVRTLRGFIASHHEPIRVIREDFMLPNPDVS
jgi:transaldolase